MNRVLNILIPIFLIAGIVDFFRLFNPVKGNGATKYAKIAGTYLTQHRYKSYRHKEHFIQIKTGLSPYTDFKFRLYNSEGISYVGIWVKGGVDGEEHNYYVFDDLKKGVYYLEYNTTFEKKRHRIKVNLDKNKTYRYSELNRYINPVKEADHFIKKLNIRDTLFIVPNELSSYDQQAIFKMYRTPQNIIIDEEVKGYASMINRHYFDLKFLKTLQGFEEKIAQKSKKTYKNPITFYYKSRTKTYQLPDDFNTYVSWKDLLNDQKITSRRVDMYDF